MKAEDVYEKMNLCGKLGIPFLFGIDFEEENGFFRENPLKNSDILFSIGCVGNYRPPQTVCPKPELTIKSSDFADYQKKFKEVHKGLLYGNTFLLNLTERTLVDCNLSLSEIFYYSKAKYKLLIPDKFVCFSPESFIQIKDNRISTFPMKGTADATLPNAEQSLIENYKEKCEHYTIVDLLRNDLNKVAIHVKVDRFRYVEQIKTIHGEILQTSSEISGEMPKNWKTDIGNIISKLLPAGSISGAPKPSTVHIIKSAEGISRGYYTGVFGYFDGSTLDSAVMIRYIEKDNGNYYFRSGGGITINSKAEEEYQEVLDKIYLSI